MTEIDSYRPGKSALDAGGVTRKRCWEHDWVLELDSKGLFDNIDHTLLLRAVRREDESRVRDRISAHNLAVLRKIALSLISRDQAYKISKRERRKQADWNDN